MRLQTGGIRVLGYQHVMSRYRTIIAFMIAPLPIPVLLSLLLQVDRFFQREGPTFVDLWWGIVFLSIFALPQAYISELALGVPAWLVIRHYEIRKWSLFAAGGAALGMAYYVAYDVARYVAAEAFAYEFVRHEHTRDLNPLHPLFAVPAGFVAAITFRAIVFPRK
jgi:hypothetical protein